LNLQTLLKKMFGVIEAHREYFQPLTTINYEMMTAELNNQMHFEIKLPESKY